MPGADRASRHPLHFVQNHQNGFSLLMPLHFTFGYGNLDSRKGQRCTIENAQKTILKQHPISTFQNSMEFPYIFHLSAFRVKGMPILFGAVLHSYSYNCFSDRDAPAGTERL